jgi:hypothetical protein
VSARKPFHWPGLPEQQIRGVGITPGYAYTPTRCGLLNIRATRVFRRDLVTCPKCLELIARDDSTAQSGPDSPAGLEGGAA